jgi:hypothetical protein
VRAVYSRLVAVAGISILAACTGGQSAIEPPSTAVNVQNTTSLQFRVGTARYPNGSTYLNTLVTYRQPNGLSGTLQNCPTITGPAGFVVPAAASAGTDAGTNHISCTPPTQPGTTALVTTFNQTGGAFAYGFAPANSNSNATANYAQFSASGANNALYADDASTIVTGPGVGDTAINIFGADVGAFANAYTQPFYIAVANKLPFLLGPPAVPDFHNGTFPAGFLGYDSGFTIFGATPVAGSYSLTVNVPSATIGQNSATFTQTSTLSSTAALPAMTPPTAASTGGGGASFTVAPAPVGVTNQVLYIVRVSGSSGSPTLYSFNVGPAGGVFTLGPTSGPSGAAPFVAGSATRAPDTVDAYVVGANYDIVGGAPPTNTAQNPTLPTQANVSVSLVFEGAYDSAAGPLTAGAKHLIR